MPESRPATNYQLLAVFVWLVLALLTLILLTGFSYFRLQRIEQKVEQCK